MVRLSLSSFLTIAHAGCAHLKLSQAAHGLTCPTAKLGVPIGIRFLFKCRSFGSVAFCILLSSEEKSCSMYRISRQYCTGSSCGSSPTEVKTDNILGALFSHSLRPDRLEVFRLFAFTSAQSV